MVHVPLLFLGIQRVDHLRHAHHAECRDRQDLCLAPLKQSGAVRARDEVDLRRQGTDLVDLAAVDTETVGRDALAHQLLRERAQRGRELLVALGPGVVAGQRLLHARLDVVELRLTLGLVRDRQRFTELRFRQRTHPFEEILAVLGERRELSRRLRRDLCELVLELAQLADPLLRFFQALRDDLFGRRLVAGLDQEPRVVGRFRFNHDDADVAVGVQAAGHGKVERALLDLLVCRERNPTPVLVPEPQTGDGPLERHPGEHDGHRRSGDRDDVERVDVIDRQDRRDDLDLVPESFGERRTQRAIDQSCGQDRRLRRAPLPTEEAAGDLAGRVHAFLDVDRQREEVELLLRLRGRDRSDEHFGLPERDQNGAVDEAGETAGLHAEDASVDVTLEREWMDVCHGR